MDHLLGGQRGAPRISGSNCDVVGCCFLVVQFALGDQGVGVLEGVESEGEVRGPRRAVHPVGFGKGRMETEF